MMSDRERQMISSAVDAAFGLIRRQGISPMKIPWDVDLESRPADVAKIDGIIAGIMDKLRPSIPKDFYEKALRYATESVQASGDPEHAVVWYRMLCTFKYVVSISKRFNGSDHPGYVDHAIAKAELHKRGLWKR